MQPATPLKAVDRYPLVNASKKPGHYEAEVRSLLSAHKDMEKNGTEILVIYNSVIDIEPVPSQLDLKLNGHGSNVMRLIISVRKDGTVKKMRGWWLEEESFREATWDWVEAE